MEYHGQRARLTRQNVRFMRGRSMSVDRHEQFIYRAMPCFAGLVALAFGAITVAIALNSSVADVVEGSESWLAVLVGLGALLSTLAALMLFADKSWARCLLAPAIGCVVLAVFIISVFFREETLFWLAVLLAVVTLLFVFDSVALFLGRNWGRLLLAVLLSALVVFVIVITVLSFGEWLAVGGFSELLANVGVALLPISCLLALVIALSSGSRSRSRLAKESGCHGHPGESTGAGVEGR
jgi:hypothetical protein